MKINLLFEGFLETETELKKVCCPDKNNREEKTTSESFINVRFFEINFFEKNEGRTFLGF